MQNLQIQNFQIIRDKNVTLIIRFSFGGIQFFAVFDIFIFCVPENQVCDIQLSSKFTGIFGCAVMLFVRFENVAFRIEAECLMKQPVAVFCISGAGRIKRFIAAAGQLSSVFQCGGKTKLTGFCGMNIKEGDIVVHNVNGFSVMNRNHMDAFAEIAAKFVT